MDGHSPSDRLKAKPHRVRALNQMSGKISNPTTAHTFSHSKVSTEIRVRYAETDQMGFVYYANYLIWFEVGRAEFCRRKGFVYRDFEHDTGAFLAVAEAQCRYHNPAQYDDLLIIETQVSEFRKRTVRFQYELIRKESQVLIATGMTLHVVLDRQGRPKSFPTSYRHFFL